MFLRSIAHLIACIISTAPVPVSSSETPHPVDTHAVLGCASAAYAQGAGYQLMVQVFDGDALFANIPVQQRAEVEVSFAHVVEEKVRVLQAFFGEVAWL